MTTTVGVTLPELSGGKFANGAMKMGSEEIFYNQSEVERGCHFC